MNRTLDLVLTNMDTTMVRRTEGIVNEDPYHPSLVLDIQSSNIKFMKGTKSPKFNFFKANYTAINALIDAFDWNSLFNESMGINEAIENYYSIINGFISSHTPKSKLSVDFPKWFSKRLIGLIHEKEFYLKMKKRTNDPVYMILFIEKRREVKREKKRCLFEYQSNIEGLIKSNPKSFFSYTKSLKKSNHLPSEMHYKNERSENINATTNLFAKYFSSVYAPDNDLDEFQCNNDCHNYLNFVDVDIKNVIVSLDSNKTNSPDGIPIVFYKNTIDTIAKPLSIIFNKSLSEMIYPDTFKISFISPVHKSGDIDNVENYRPISIVSAIAKIYDKLIHNHILSKVHCLITNVQHGFSAGKSTATNLLEYVDYLSKNMMGGGQVDTIYMDLAKAFDKIDHNILLRKLSNYPISPCLISLLKSYLSDRKQYVCVYGEKSDSITPHSSVPQGSILSPLLFALFINDLPTLIKCRILLFADDLKIFLKINSLEDARQLQNDINIVLQWCTINNLHVNANKCYIMSFTKRRDTTFQYFSYKLNGLTIERVNSIRDLGVIFDAKLSFENHFRNITTRAYRILGFISRNLYNFQNIKTYMTLYNVYIRSILDYCSPVWSPFYQNHIDSLERVQRKFTRMVYRKFHYPIEPYNTRLIRLQMLSLEDRRLLTDELMLYKIKNERIHISVEHNFQPARRDLRNNRLFYLPFVTNNIEFYSPILRMHRQHMEVFSSLDLYEPCFASFKRYSIYEIKQAQTITYND